MHRSSWADPRTSAVPQINLAQLSGSITPNPEPPYPPPSFPPLTIGGMVKHFTYDGLGRLIRTESPYPDPSTTSGQLRTERFYYDGIRRIQEVVTDPILDTGTAAASGDSDAMSAVASSEEVDPKAATLKTEENQAAASGGAPVVYLDREYVWGPGDGNAGVDELLVQYDRNRLPGWIMQDGGGDVAAIADLGGAGSTARVAGQWTYDAYGAPVSADTLYTHSLVRCGHKGLFVDRLDGGIVNGSGAETPRLAVGANLLVQMRNRAYSPSLGRFMQADPKATAMTLLEATSYHGRGAKAISLAFDTEERYSDGMNLYQYLGSNPWIRNDPLGLSYDPFDAMDEILGEASGSTAAFLAQIGQSIAATAVVAATIASYLPFPFVGNLGELALYALGEQSATATAVGIGMGLIPGGKLLKKFGGTKLGTFLSRVGSAAWSIAKEYAAQIGRKIFKALAGPGLWLAEKALSFISKSCGCFEAGTPVWTSRGFTPIEDVEPGDWVFAEDEGSGAIKMREVLSTFVRRSAPIVAVLLISTADLKAQQLDTTEEHPFYVEGRGWIAAQQLVPGDAVRTASGSPAIVREVLFTDRLATVYNFEVDGLHNYRVGTDGVLTHNLSCKLHLHHWIPQQRAIKRWVEARGINIEDFTQLISAEFHRELHGNHLRPQDYIPRWKRFMEAQPNATRSEIENFVEHLRAYYEQARVGLRPGTPCSDDANGHHLRPVRPSLHAVTQRQMCRARHRFDAYYGAIRASRIRVWRPSRRFF